MQSRISSSTPIPDIDSTSSSIMLPAIVVSVLINLITGGFILSTYIQPAERREGSSYPQSQPQTTHNLPEPEYGEKIKQSEDIIDDRTGEQRFDNQHLQDMYIELPRSFLYNKYLDTY